MTIEKLQSLLHQARLVYAQLSGHETTKYFNECPWCPPEKRSKCGRKCAEAAQLYDEFLQGCRQLNVNPRYIEAAPVTTLELMEIEAW